ARAGTEREPDRCGPAQFGPVQFGPVQFGPVQFGPEEDGPDGFAPGARTARTDAQLRADVLTDLLLEGELPDDPGFPRGVRGRVCVTVPVLTLLGCRPGGPAAGVPADAPVLEG